MKLLSKTFVYGCVVVGHVFLAGWAVAAAPVVVGLAGKHRLTESHVGEVLIAELQCAACHHHKGDTRLSLRTAPDLSDVGGRVAPKFIQHMIAAPHAARSGTTMPDLLSAEPPEKREEIAVALTHFLVSQSRRGFRHEGIAPPDAAAGKELFHTIGCIACHSPRDDAGRETLRDEDGNEVPREQFVELAHLPKKYSRPSLEEFLFQPLRVRASGRMPDMKLTPVESRQLTAYLLAPGGGNEQPLNPDPQRVEQGKSYFQQFQCAACHRLEGIPEAKKFALLAEVDPTRGCLSDASKTSPRFHLSDTQIKAIRAALSEKKLAAKPDAENKKALLAMTLTAFNCIGCHLRDDYGGVAPERNGFFQGTEKNFGDDARIPPPLTLIGAKLRSPWMKKVLFDGESVRLYMYARMPQFGEANVRPLPDWFASLDGNSLEAVDLRIRSHESDDKKDREREKELRPAGRELLGDKALNCVACHNFNGKPSPTRGINLLTSFERLQPSYFYHFLKDPARYRPRIVMPYSWPGGMAMQKTILQGDTRGQIEAIWYYLSLGTSAPLPSGITNTQTKIEVGSATRTYRGRSSVAGFRGIAVGFPAGVHYAFNAQTGTLSAIWRGEFINVERGGQGSGTFHPASRAIALAQDVSFCELADEKSPWPLRPVMNKEQRENLDPLYPKNRGYQFKGYFFDNAMIPTFMYRSGEIEIEDRSTAEASEKSATLKRTIQFTSPQEHSIWFRAIVGKIEEESRREFKTADVRLTIPAEQAVLREMEKEPKDAKEQGVKELLIRFTIPKGKTSATFIYELR